MIPGGEYNLSNTLPAMQPTALTAWRQDAERWNVSEVVRPAFSASTDFFVLWIFNGLGLGAVCFALSMAGFLVSPLWQLICPFDVSALAFNTGWFCALLGAGCGGWYALSRLQRAARATRSDGPRRRLSDYCSPLFWLLPGLCLLLFCGLVLIAHPAFQPINGCLGERVFNQPWQTAYILPALGLICLSLVFSVWLLVCFAAARSPLIPTPFIECSPGRQRRRGLDDP
jgi:hypothetical protein